jgi:hypothetical protein
MFADVMKVFNESKHRRVRGRFADIPGKGDDAPKKGRRPKRTTPANLDPKKLRYVRNMADFMGEGYTGPIKAATVQDWIRQDMENREEDILDNADDGTAWAYERARDKVDQMWNTNYSKEVKHVVNEWNAQHRKRKRAS